MSIFKNLPLQRKITLVIMLTSLTTLVIAASALFVLELNEFKQSMVRELNSVAAVIGSSSEAALEFDDPKAGAQTLAALDEDSRIIAAALYDEEGKIFAVYQAPGSDVQIPFRPSLDEAGVTASSLHVFKPIRHEGRVIGTIYVHATDRDVYSRLLRHGLLVLLILAVCAVAAYFISRPLRDFISRPILNLARTAKLVSTQNDFSLRAVKEGDDETGWLVDQFNEMLEEIGKKNRALAEAAHQLRLITDSLPVLIAYVDNEERYQFANAMYTKWFGLLPEQVKGKSVREVVGEPAYRYLKTHIDAALGGAAVAFEQRVHYEGAGERYVSCSLIPDFHEGVVQGYFGLITDISERKRFEDQLRVLNEALEQRVEERTRALEESQERLRRSERLASIGTLAAGVAHEIRNPLNSILLVTQYALRYRNDIDPALREMLGNVTNEAKRCAAIIKNILLFAKAERTERSRHDLNEVVRHACDLAKSYLGGEQAKINLNLSDAQIPVMLNPTEIEQVLVNLINNAAEATPNKVEIAIRSIVDGTTAKLTVEDDGPGIPEEIMQHIFDPFFSTKRTKGNTGLGLSLSHGIIVDHGGRMEVQSELGRGTMFSIELPVEHKT